jgi:ligand-binding SRPBCC domain-containing protein
MHLKVESKVSRNYKEVFEGFTESLFLRLNPPFPKVKLLKFDGCKKGDKVVIELNFLLFKQIWESDIIDFQESEQEIFFIDRGNRLPFFLKEWQHKHRIVRIKGAVENQTMIIDDIEYNCPFWLPSFLMYIPLYLQFMYRRPIYKKVFGS